MTRDTKKNRHSLKWTHNLTRSFKHRRHILSKALLHSSTGSFIRVREHNRIPPRTEEEKPEKIIDEIIVINLCGTRYETKLSTLEHYPNTLLGDPNKRKRFWNKEKKEYFFDRHRACFEAILYYYQSNGRLRRPDYVPLDTFLEEVLFFELGPEAMAEIDRLENVSFVKRIHLPNLFWRRYIWFYLECPQHSTVARIFYLISMLLTAVSCITLAIETLPKFNDELHNPCAESGNSTRSSSDIYICSASFKSPFLIIQTICVAYFTIEFILRLISTPSYYRFVLSIMNWMDLASIVPYYVVLGLGLTNRDFDFSGNSFILLRLIRAMRFLRLFKIYLIFKQLKSLRVLSSTLKESFTDFIIMMIILTLISFLFGAATYFAEQSANGDVFDSIPKAAYWGIITITTVGYGDMYPVTAIGRILACACALIGAATTGMLVSVLVDRYQRIYNRKKFFPEQVLSSGDSNESEHREKEDFIRKKLGGLKKSESNKPVTLPALLPYPMLPSIYRNQPEYQIPRTSHARFIISFTVRKGTSKSSATMIRTLIQELTEAISNTGNPIHLQLISNDIIR